MRSALPAVAAGLLLGTTQAFDTSAYEKTSAPFRSDAYLLHWTADLAANKIALALEVRTQGWVGFGIPEVPLTAAHVSGHTVY